MKTKTNKIDGVALAEHMLALELNNAAEVLANAATTLEDQAREMRSYAERFVAARHDENGVKPEDVLGWAVNSVGSLHSNMRLDLFVSRAVSIATVRAELRAERRLVNS